MDRPLTDSKSFVNKTEEKQVEHIKFLREKRLKLQVGKKKKERPVKLPKFEFKTQEHKLYYLGLPPEIRRLFV